MSVTRIRLSDGRYLGYSEYGDPGAFPVINCHGGLVCRLDVASLDDVAARSGVRLVSPDRPGIASSDPKEGRTTSAWAEDVRELADRLELSRFAVMGWSMGGQYALACSYALGDRVTRTAVVAGALPLEDPATFAELNRTDRRLTRLSQRRPALARCAFAVMGTVARRAPRVLLRDDPPEGLATAMAVALRPAGGMVEEYRAWVRPWGFRPEEVTGPVAVWHGADDELVPPSWASRLSEAMPRAILHMVPGEGHFLPFHRGQEILHDLLARASGA